MDVRCANTPAGNASRAEEEQDNISLLRDAVPQLESLFVISQAIGHGTFSSVYLARTRHTTTINGRRHFAIKHIIPTSHPSRVFMELKCLKLLGGSDNVMGVTMCFREMNHVVLVMPYFPHDNFVDYVGCLTTAELQNYLKNLLLALRRVHSFAIIHRDVKPANFLFSRKLQKFSLVDFGLAQEVSQIKASLQNQKCGSVRPQVSTAGRMQSPATTETPHLGPTRTVKRKLVVSPRTQQDKRLRCGSPTSTSVSSILSATSNRVNTAVRNSPKKHGSSAPSPKKENQELLGASSTPANPALTLQDSPSKHTRGAEALRRLHQTPDDTSGAEGGDRCEGVGAGRGLRRSPRKVSSAASHSTPLEGLAKHLQEGSSRHALSGAKKTPVPRAGSSKGLKFRARENGQDVSSITKDKTFPAKATPPTRVLQEVKTGKGRVYQAMSCRCYGHARICGVCGSRTNQVAPRAGTPGFRAPEVLLRHPDQGTAVDMWSVGVILLCLLSGRYPFFRAVDDLSTLTEIATLLGTSVLKKTAAHLGKLFTTSESREPLDLMQVCETLRTGSAVGGGDAAQPCPGCRQRGVCVCLTSGARANYALPSSAKKNNEADFSLGDSSASQKKIGETPSASTLDSSVCETTLPSVIEIESSEIPQRNMAPVTPSYYRPSYPVRPREVDTVTITPRYNKPTTPVVTTTPCQNSSEIIEIQQSDEKIKRVIAPSYPPLAYHLLLRLLDPNPDTRITAHDALAHPFLNTS